MSIANLLSNAEDSRNRDNASQRTYVLFRIKELLLLLLTELLLFG